MCVSQERPPECLLRKAFQQVSQSLTRGVTVLRAINGNVSTVLKLCTTAPLPQSRGETAHWNRFLLSPSEEWIHLPAPACVSPRSTPLGGISCSPCLTAHEVKGEKRDHPSDEKRETGTEGVAGQRGGEGPQGRGWSRSPWSQLGRSSWVWGYAGEGRLLSGKGTGIRQMRGEVGVWRRWGSVVLVKEIPELPGALWVWERVSSHL